MKKKGYLSKIVLILSFFDSDPLARFQGATIEPFDNFEHIRHFFSGDHLLGPETQPQITDTFDSLLQMCLLESFNVNVT